MAYQATKPLSTDLLSQSQTDISTNFTEIKTLVDVNHETFGSAAGQGKHFFVQFPLKTISAANQPATAITEFAIYNAANGAGNAALWLRTNNAAGVVTGDKDITTNNQTGAKGWCWLPNGILAKWGIVNMTATTTSTESYIVGPGAFTTVYLVQVNTVKASAANMDGAIARSYTTTQVVIRNTSTTAVEAHYLILGKI
jgi:hypothetical protein